MLLLCHEGGALAVNNNTWSTFIKSLKDGVIGLAPIYGTSCALRSLAMSTSERVLIVMMSKRSCSKTPGDFSPRKLLQDGILCNPNITISAFNMGQLASALNFDVGVQITEGIDLLSLPKASRQSMEALTIVLGGELTLNKNSVIELFWNEESSRNDPHITGLQAWAAYCAATLPNMVPKLNELPQINTLVLDASMLRVICKTIRNLSRLVSLKPTRTKNKIKQKFNSKSGKVEVLSSRFKTRIRTTAGHQLPTSAEGIKSAVMLGALQRSLFLDSNPFIQSIWFPNQRISWSKSPYAKSSPTFYFPSSQTLNPSQAKAVNDILSNAAKHRVSLIQGPPGTKKMTVIAASVTSLVALPDKSLTIWLVAQSNVAVKNIAEKLAEVGFYDFKILVSKDFHFDWHKHLYEKIHKNIIRLDNFAEDLVAAERQLLVLRIILCTLSMLTNTKAGVFSLLVPIQHVIFDEASQIEIGNYFPMLVCFCPTLCKLVFIGDNKQLAPYGQGDISTLESVFEKTHLKKKAMFLNTQYRMPLPIGSFISRNVYGGLLKSQHIISNENCCRFVDVSNGVEESYAHSWRNSREVDVAIKIASQLNDLGKLFRIITPYDPQRSLLESCLKRAKLPWEDKCFNIDAFQGNEDAYIIISLVRSEKMGFLKEARRVNVMLTRCKKGMIICTNRNFIEGKGQLSLVGKHAQLLGEPTWVAVRQVLYEGVQPFT
ncbi:P-loop containing nucleoside triphosphate hydrolase protein [Crassisporium funariophilum]|nr:P-loop containing nucleoside triphosphate hydrolase protein [Crassisporium funariophilum]